MADSEFITEVRQLRDTIEKEAGNELSKERRKLGDKFLKNIEKHLNDMMEIAEEFRVPNVESNDTSAVEKYSHKIYEGVVETLKQLDPPEKITLQSVNRYLDTIQKELENLTKNVFSKYIKLLDRKYGKRVKSLDKAYLRIFKDLEETRKFLVNKYNPKASIEEGLWILDDILDLEKRYLQVIEELKMEEQTINKLQNQIDSIMKEIAELENSPLFHKKKTVDEAFSQMQKELDNYLTEIRKALRKFINKSSKSKDKIDVSLAKEIVTDAASAFAKQSSVTGLKTIFSDIMNLLESNEIEMKRDKKNTAIDNLKELLDGKLEEIWEKSRKLMEDKTGIAKEIEEKDIEGKIAKLTNTLEGAKRDMQRIVERKLREAEKIQDEIKKLTEKLEMNTGHHLKTSLPPLPEFVEKTKSSN
ncbi:MAG: hypothetical protein D6732_14490 [Methanobacteriota archaeon]|nr:MAG: hypothetical protein D6732_14490 [Euryarchaeota archaeon]